MTTNSSGVPPAHAGAAEQRAATIARGDAVLDVVLTALSLLGLAVWAGLSLLIWPMGVLMSSGNCTDASTELVCSDWLETIAFLPAGSALTGLVLGLASCLASRRVRGWAITIGYVIALAGAMAAGQLAAVRP